MSTYITVVLGCLTAMAIVAYGKTLRGRVRRREPLFRRKDNYSWDDYDNY